jgi:hypothetical protein
MFNMGKPPPAYLLVRKKYNMGLSSRERAILARENNEKIKAAGFKLENRFSMDRRPEADALASKIEAATGVPMTVCEASDL